MLIAYDTNTGNVRKFVQKLNLDAFQIDSDIICKEPFVLITYTAGFGHIPQKTSKFLEKNYPLLAGVSASGNRNLGSNFAKSADTISQIYKVPILSKFELNGTIGDVHTFLEAMKKHFNIKLEV